jgi:hypothetical protein
MVCQRCRDTGLPGDVRHGHRQRALIADDMQRRIHKRLAAHRFHSDFRHHCPFVPLPAVFLIDPSINKKAKPENMSPASDLHGAVFDEFAQIQK